MAPPIVRSRPAPQRQRRSAADIIIGMLAVLALIALTIGVPYALVTFLGLPIPHTMPSMSDFSHQLDVFAIMKVLSVLVWLAWLQLVCCVIAEIRAAVRNVGVPAQIPLAGGTQMLVHRLVTAALLLVTASAVLAPALAQHATPAPARPVTASASVTPGPSLRGQPDGRAAATPAAAADQAAHHQAVEKIYVVKPPVGRYHESLWEIAHNHLGDGRRYREIFEMNSDRVQPDGTKLTISSLIRPGWVLHMPRDAHGPGIEVVRPGHEHGHAGGADHQAGHGASHHEAGHQGASLGGAASQNGAGSGAGGQRGAVAAPAAHAGHHLSYPEDLAAASLLAAGVLSALGRRRREQLWRRAFGRQIAVPDAEAADAEAALRLGAHEPATLLLDTGLRHLSSALGQAGRTPPTVVAAHLSGENLDLWVAPADLAPPAPWTAVGDGQVWRLPFAALQRLDAGQVASAAAPFPGLVSLGTDSGGRVLVDLEAAHGLICVSGPQETVTAALSAMAVELATNRWSDRMSITLVGFGEDLTLLAPDRITAVASLAEALPGLEARAAQVADALAASGIGSVLTGRSLGINPDAWAPHYLIMATPPAPEEQQRLLALATVRHAAAAGYVVAGDVPGAAWTWQLTGEGQLTADLLGFDVQAQLLPPRQHAALVELFRTAAEPAGPVLDPLPSGGPAAVPAAHLEPGSVLPAEVTMLGQAAVRAPGIIEPDRVAQVTELVMYLAAHPDGVHPNVLTGTLWPRGVTAEVREAAFGRAREWLGEDAAGRPNLDTDSAGRLRLGEGVRVDWLVFRALAGLAEQARAQGQLAAGGAGGPGGLGGPGSMGGLSGGGASPAAAMAEEERYLARALDLVGGPLLAGRDAGRYAWLAADGLEYEVAARVADAAHRLVTLRLEAGQAAPAMDAARAGLRLAFADELLWRDLLLAAHATGDAHLVRSVVDEVCARTALDEVLPRMAPETEALIDEICPSWRTSVA
ncbi:MAG TPA: hypothetical protein VFV41_12175 [Streptosporangiaceae bacterium]|nr:hypothetical protein [Streptosporangiaceae bacterium]